MDPGARHTADVMKQLRDEAMQELYPAEEAAQADTKKLAVVEGQKANLERSAEELVQQIKREKECTLHLAEAKKAKFEKKVKEYKEGMELDSKWYLDIFGYAAVMRFEQVLSEIGALVPEELDPDTEACDKFSKFAHTPEAMGIL